MASLAPAVAPHDKRVVQPLKSPPDFTLTREANITLHTSALSSSLNPGAAKLKPNKKTKIPRLAGVAQQASILSSFLRRGRRERGQPETCEQTLEQPGLQEQPCRAWHGRSNRRAGTAACWLFQHLKPLPSLFLLPFPKGLFPFLCRQAQGLASHLLQGQLPLPPFHPFTCPQGKLIKHQSHSQGCTSSWVHSWIMCSLAAQGTFPSNTR